MLGTYELARQANQLETHGYRFRADRLREVLERRNCCTECGTKLIFNEQYYQETGFDMCPICDGTLK